MPIDELVKWYTTERKKKKQTEPVEPVEEEQPSKTLIVRPEHYFPKQPEAPLEEKIANMIDTSKELDEKAESLKNSYFESAEFLTEKDEKLKELTSKISAREEEVSKKEKWLETMEDSDFLKGVQTKVIVPKNKEGETK